jgi:cyclase
MLRHRVIPCLLLKGGGLVKTTKFKDPKYIGDPVNAIRIFNEKEVDELIVLDIEASQHGREPNYALIEEFAGECFMPLAYGGGVSTVEQAKALIARGVEKLCIQTAALEDLGIVRQIADRFGSQSVVVSVDVKRGLLGTCRMYSGARKRTLDGAWPDFVGAAARAGAGEIFLTAVDRDGTLSGMDVDLIREAAAACSIPIIAAGGAATLPHMRAAVDAGASAIAAGAMFVFHGPHRAVLITYPRYDDLITALDQ